jgi:uncharacterized protein (TIGR02271 family)
MIKIESMSKDKHYNFQEEQFYFNKSDVSRQSGQSHLSRLHDKLDKYKQDKTNKNKEDAHVKISGDENSAKHTRINRDESSVTSAIPGEQEEGSKLNETRIPVVEEKLEINKVQSIVDLTVTKESVTEITTVDVPIAYEEITIRRRPVNEATTGEQTGEGPVRANTAITIPLMKEEIEISKQPYVKEEVVIKKKPVVETRTVTEEVKSEKVKVRRGTEEVVHKEEEKR